jgi:hypothetical protein
MNRALPAALAALLVAACGKDEPAKTSSTPEGTKPAPTGTKPTLDASSPRALAESIFAIAKGGDLSLLPPIADPVDPDGDTKDIAEIAKAPAERQAEFRRFFGPGRVTGEPKVEGDRAEVPILFGPNGDKPETFRMVRRDGRWHLQSF